MLLLGADVEVDVATTERVNVDLLCLLLLVVELLDEAPLRDEDLVVDGIDDAARWFTVRVMVEVDGRRFMVVTLPLASL